MLHLIWQNLYQSTKIKNYYYYFSKVFNPKPQKMIKIKEYKNKIKSYCDFYLEYDLDNEKYKFNRQFIDDIKTYEFQNTILELQNELIDVLMDIKKPQVFIKDILEEINKIAVWYEDKKICDFENFDQLSKLIVTTKDNKIIESDSDNTIETIRLNNRITEDYSDDIYSYLIFYKNKTNNYEEEIDFEKVKLHYAISSYFESIYSFIEYLLMLDDILSKYGIEDYNQFRPIPKPNLRCTVNLSKIETANLFNAFFECEYFFFDLKSEKKREQAKMAFIDNNFNYINPHGKIANVSKIIKEFGEIGTHEHVEHQKKIIDSLINKLTSLRGSIRTTK
jgi:hypothetical protein